MRNEKISDTRLYKKVKFKLNITKTISEIRTNNLEIRTVNVNSSIYYECNTTYRNITIQVRVNSCNVSDMK